MLDVTTSSTAATTTLDGAAVAHTAVSQSPTLGPSQHLHSFTLSISGDATTLMLIIFLALSCLLVCGVYAACISCALRGDLDLIVDEETGRPMNTLHFVNPLRGRNWRRMRNNNNRQDNTMEMRDIRTC